MKTTGLRDEETTFLNVDLDMWAAYDLAPLVAALGAHVSDMFTGAVQVEEGAYQTHLELATGEREPWNPDAAIQTFVRLIEGLPPAARRLWDGANLRNFEIGIQSGRDAPSVPVLAASGDLGGRIAAESERGTDGLRRRRCPPSATTASGSEGMNSLPVASFRRRIAVEPRVAADRAAPGR
jgi:hypothetical protein